MARISVEDFVLANPIYIGATVNFYTVDTNGVKTTTLQTLYAGITGSTTLANPQYLDSEGKFQQTVYVDSATIATVSGLTIADHDTGVINPNSDVEGHRAATQAMAAWAAWSAAAAKRIKKQVEDFQVFVNIIQGYVGYIAGLAKGALRSKLAAAASATAAAASALAASNSETAAGASATTASNAISAATAIAWTFDASTTMADPGTGDVRFNNAAVNLTTAIALSAQSSFSGNPDVSNWVATWDDSTNTTGKATLTIRKSGAPATFAKFTVTAVTDNGTWLQVAVTHVDSNGALSAADVLYVQSAATGDKGADGVGSVVSVTAADTSITIGGTATDPTVQRAALTGDVTASAGSNSTTIANDAVTYAKMQNVSATSRVLGRKTAGAGDPEELTLSETLDLIGSAAQGDVLIRGAAGWQRLGAGTIKKVLRSAGAGADLTWEYVDGTMIRVGSDAQGDILYFNGTDWVRLGAGTSGHYLKTLGAGANPTWAAVSSGGFTLGTPQSFASSDITFTGIPSGVNQVVMSIYDNASLGVNWGVQIGPSGGVETTGYQGPSGVLYTTAGVIIQTNSGTTQFDPANSMGACTNLNGTLILTRTNSSSNTWSAMLLAWFTAASTACHAAYFGRKSITGSLDRVKLLGVGAAGTVNIAYL